MATTAAYALAALGLSFLGAFLLTPFTSKLAMRWGVIDIPSPDAPHKHHRAPVPYLGGVAIFIGLGGGAAILMLPGAGSDTSVGRFAVTILAGLGLGLVGLADDVRPLARTFRLAVQIAAAGVAWAMDFRVSLTGNQIIDIAITIFWIVGITNAFNLLDNMDGLSAGLAAVCAASFAIIGLVGQLPEVAIVSSALAGASMGFLRHNREPAKAFMGDAGSLFLGFLLALIGIKLRFENLIEVTFMVPIVVLGIPLLDTTLVVLSRFRNGRPLFLGGRDHISHRLVQVGMPVRAAVGLMYSGGLALGWLGLVISRSSAEVGWMLLGFVLVMLCFIGALLLRVPVYEEEAAGAPIITNDGAKAEHPRAASR